MIIFAVGGCKANKTHKANNVDKVPNATPQIESIAPWCICKEYNSDINVMRLIQDNPDMYSYVELTTEKTLGEKFGIMVVSQLNKYEMIKLFCFENEDSAIEAYSKMLVCDCDYQYKGAVAAFGGSLVRIGNQVILSGNSSDCSYGVGNALRGILALAELKYPQTTSIQLSATNLIEYEDEINYKATIANIQNQGYNIVQLVDRPVDTEESCMVFDNSGLLIGRIDRYNTRSVGVGINDIVSNLAGCYNSNFFEFLYTQDGIVIVKYTNDALTQFIVTKD